MTLTYIIPCFSISTHEVSEALRPPEPENWSKKGILVVKYKLWSEIFQSNIILQTLMMLIVKIIVLKFQGDTTLKLGTFIMSWRGNDNKREMTSSSSDPKWPLEASTRRTPGRRVGQSQGGSYRVMWSDLRGTDAAFRTKQNRIFHHITRA